MTAWVRVAAAAAFVAGSSGQASTPYARGQRSAVHPPPATAPAATRPAGEAPAREIDAILAARVTVEFDRTPFEHVVTWIERETQAMVYVRWPALEDVGIERDAPITLRARDRPLQQVLALILKDAEGVSGAKLAYEASADLFIFSTHDDLSRELITRVYRVEDLLQEIPKFEGPKPGQIAPGAGGRAIRSRPARVIRPARGSQSQGGGEVHTPGGAAGHDGGGREDTPGPRVAVPDERSRELIDLITMVVEPESWEINGLGGRGTIFPRDGRLIVRNSRYVHQLLGGLAGDAGP